jgi:hypothetical protein
LLRTGPRCELGFDECGTPGREKDRASAAAAVSRARKGLQGDTFHASALIWPWAVRRISGFGDAKGFAGSRQGRRSLERTKRETAPDKGAASTAHSPCRSVPVTVPPPPPMSVVVAIPIASLVTIAPPIAISIPSLIAIAEITATPSAVIPPTAIGDGLRRLCSTGDCGNKRRGRGRSCKSQHDPSENAGSQHRLSHGSEPFTVFNGFAVERGKCSEVPALSPLTP